MRITALAIHLSQKVIEGVLDHIMCPTYLLSCGLRGQIKTVIAIKPRSPDS